MSGEKIGEVVQGLRGNMRSLLASVERHQREEWSGLESSADLDELLENASDLCKRLSSVDTATQAAFRADLDRLSGQVSGLREFEKAKTQLASKRSSAEQLLDHSYGSDLNAVRDRLSSEFDHVSAAVADTHSRFHNAKETVGDIKLKLTELTLWRDSGSANRDQAQSIEEIRAALRREAELAELAGRLKKATEARQSLTGDLDDWLQSQEPVEQLQAEFDRAEQHFASGDSKALSRNLVTIDESLEALRVEMARNKELKTQMQLIKTAVVETLRNLGYTEPRPLVKKGDNLSPIRIVANPPNLGPTVRGEHEKLKRSFDGTVELSGRFEFEIFGVEKHESKLCRDFIDGMEESDTLSKNDLELTMLHRGVLEEEPPLDQSSVTTERDRPEIEAPERDRQS